MSQLRCSKCRSYDVYYTGQFVIEAKGRYMRGEIQWLLNGLVSKEPMEIIACTCEKCGHVWSPSSLKEDTDF